MWPFDPENGRWLTFIICSAYACIATPLDHNFSIIGGCGAIANKVLYLHNEAHDQSKTWTRVSPMVEHIDHTSNSIFRKKSHMEGFPKSGHKWLGMFVAETEKTLYEVLCGLLRHAQSEDPTFPNFWTLHNIMNSLFRKLWTDGVGSEKKISWSCHKGRGVQTLRKVVS